MTEESQPTDQAPPEGTQPTPEVPRIGTLIQQQLEEALREKEQFRAMAQRAQADLINYKRRAAEEQAELKRNANAQLLLRLLAIVDDLDRALALIPDGAVAPGWVDGMRLVQRNITNLLDSERVTRIVAEGQPFEPWEHEAVLYEETPDGREGVVVRVIREGYKLHDRVLRAAQVSVSKAPAPRIEPTDAQQEAT